MLRWVIGALGVATGATALVSCGDSGGTGGESSGTSGGACSPDIASIQSTVFVPSCAGNGCHEGADPAAQLDLTASGVEARLVNQPAATCDALLVAPGDPAASFLVQKVVETSPACGARMPPAAPLAEAQIACITTWIQGLDAGCETCGTGACVDVQTSDAHCGACDAPCDAGSTCEGGSCVCAVGTACGGACVNTDTDPDNCGACGTACPPVQVCDLGDCAQGCSGGRTQCGQSCVDTTTDPAHCGDCDVSCGVGGTCDASVCTCPGGADPQTDPENCGACGNVCAPGQTCEAGTCTCAAGTVSFGQDVQPIFTARCATVGCHTGAAPKEGLHLGSGRAYDGLVGVPSEQCGDRLRVAPGQPSDSYLMDKLLGVDLCSGSRMPKLSPLSSADLEIISTWICADAPDN